MHEDATRCREGFSFVPWPLNGANLTAEIPAQEEEIRVHQDKGEKELNVEHLVGI